RVDGAPLFPIAARPAAPELPDQPLVARLRQVMEVERRYRQEGLSIGMLATAVGLPEYRLRRLINGSLGYRNFAAFLNHYRLADARAALTDPAQAEVPILTIALDAGFNSLGPFNRAFKAETGMTPSEYRRTAAAEVRSNAA
ncbi:MAG: helix-turn-helix domain-containing protein, partial [Ferrovibrionaceae bacterium]